MSNLSFDGGKITRDFAKLPAESQIALALRGFAHLLGNEQASRVVSKIRGAIAEASPKDSNGAKRKVESVTKDEVRAFREANAAQVTAWTKECQGEALKDLDEGKLGTRVAGPRLDPITAAMNAIARREVINTLKSHNLKVPKGDETLTFPDGTRTMAQMVANYAAKHEERLRREAEKQVADEARKRKAAEAKAKELAVAGGAKSAATLGL